MSLVRKEDRFSGGRIVEQDGDRAAHHLRGENTRGGLIGEKKYQVVQDGR